MEEEEEEEELLEQRLLTTTTFSRTANDAQWHHWNHSSYKKKFNLSTYQTERNLFEILLIRKTDAGAGEATELLEKLSVYDICEKKTKMDVLVSLNKK